MVAIETKYIGPTDTKPSRIRASTSNGQSLTMGYDHELTTDDAHAKVAIALRDKMGWKGEMVCGATKAGLVFVFANDVHYGKD